MIDKRTAFSETDQQMALFAKALSHPARVQILRYLAEQQTCMCGDIVEVLPLAQSTVSQHLKELKLAGLIEGSIDGNASCYCIDNENFERFKSMLGSFTKEIDEKSELNCC